MRTSLFVIIGHVSHVQGKNVKLTQQKDGEIALNIKESMTVSFAPPALCKGSLLSKAAVQQQDMIKQPSWLSGMKT